MVEASFKCAYSTLTWDAGPIKVFHFRKSAGEQLECCGILCMCKCHVSIALVLEKPDAESVEIVEGERHENSTYLVRGT